MPGQIFYVNGKCNFAPSMNNTDNRITITFLGTGTSQGVPVIACPCEVCASTDAKDKRLRSSILVQSATTAFVIDTGPDFRYQMLREKVLRLDAVVFTHEHKDHIAGLDDIRAFNFRSGRKMQVFCTSRVENALRREFMYVFDEVKYPGVPEIEIVPISEKEPFFVGDIQITPILVYHYKLPVLGFRIHDFTYITDASSIPDEEMEKIKGSSVIVLNALRKEPHISHFNLEQAIEMMRQLNPQQGYFTHISHLLGKHADVEQQLPPGIHLAYDGLKLTV